MPEGLSTAAQSFIKDGQIPKIGTPESLLQNKEAA